MSERPWIEHDGSGCPYPKGVLVERKYRGGDVWTFPIGMGLYFSGEMAPDANYLLCWDWSHPEHDHHVIAHRLHVDPQAEADRVNARQALFHGWIKEAETLPTCVPPEPVEPREKVR